MKNVLQRLLPVFLVTIMPAGQAVEPTVKTPSPVIYLADNLDEKDNLGWCIDTVGRGFAERLHAHSCKPRGGDVQFRYSLETGQIMSAEFSNFCMANRPDAATDFGLETCDQSDEQQFTYNTTRRELSPASSPGKCVVVGSESKSAGPFMSRKLLLADCSTTDGLFKEWIVRE